VSTTRKINCSTSPDGDLARLASTPGEAGAAEAEAEICRRFARRVRLFGLRHLRQPHAADDLVQRVLLLTLQKLRAGAVREPDRIGSFVLGVARTLVHESHRSRRPETELDEQAVTLPALPPADPDPFAAMSLARCLDALAARERSIVVQTYYGEAGSAEIARSMAIAEGHVRVIRHRAIGRLRDCLGLDAPVARAGSQESRV
jgi:RNA polymerase sigma-70 factor, ECF subfamily